MTKIEQGDYVLAFWLISSKPAGIVVRAIRDTNSNWQLEGDFHDHATSEVGPVTDLTCQLDPIPICPDDAYYQAMHRVEDAYVRFPRSARAILQTFPIFDDDIQAIEKKLSELRFREAYARATRKL